MDLTVLLLARDEAGPLGWVLPELAAVLGSMAAEAEILVVDGRSKDETVEICRSHGARVIVQSEPGYGAAFREGIAAAAGESIVTLDADGSHHPSYVATLYDRRGEADLVIGSRYCPGGSYEGLWSRYLLSRILNAVFRRALALPIRDVSSGLRLYRAAAVRGLRLAGSDFDILEEALVHIGSRGGRIIEVPIRFLLRRRGISKSRVLRLGWRYAGALGRLARVRFGRRPRPPLTP